MKLIVTPKAQKEISRIQKTEQIKVDKKLHLLEEEPFLGKKLSGELEGFRSLRSWPYRIIYHINGKEKEIWVDNILHRQEAYK